SRPEARQAVRLLRDSRLEALRATVPDVAVEVDGGRGERITCTGAVEGLVLRHDEDPAGADLDTRDRRAELPARLVRGCDLAHNSRGVTLEPRLGGAYNLSSALPPAMALRSLGGTRLLALPVADPLERRWTRCVSRARSRGASAAR